MMEVSSAPPDLIGIRLLDPGGHSVSEWKMDSLAAPFAKDPVFSAECILGSFVKIRWL